MRLRGHYQLLLVELVVLICQAEGMGVQLGSSGWIQM